MKKLVFLLLATFAGLVFAQSLTGAGATFPYPLYAKMFDEYNKLTGIKVNYQSIGSGGGIRQLSERTVNFAGSDAFLSDEQMKDIKAKTGATVLHIPMALGAVVPTYNLPGVSKTLNFTGPLLADIFLNKVKTWNDPAIQQLNPDAKLPPLPITVVHRSDGSGTTFIWVDYLSKVSREWAQTVGRGTSVQWPTGLGGKGNEGVAGVVRQTPGAIGYVELIYAKQNKMPHGAVQNKAGRFVLASLAATSEAASVVLPGDARVSITDTASPSGYPVAGFTWILIYDKLELVTKSEAEAREVVKLINWMLTDGQKIHETLDYGALPGVADTRAKSLLSRVTYQGKPIGKEIVGN